MTVSVSDFAADTFGGELLSVAVTEKLELPAAIGVPLMVPPAESVRLGGRLPELMVHVYGAVPPEAANAVE